MSHFVFWGLFVAAAAILVGYIVWMRIDEGRAEAASRQPPKEKP